MKLAAPVPFGGTARPSPSSIAAWSFLALSVAFTVGRVTINLLTPSLPGQFPRALDVPLAIALLAYPGVGALIVTRRPDNAVGWAFLAMGVALCGTGLAGYYRDYTIVVDPGALPGGTYVSWLGGIFFSAWLASLMFLLLLYPDGQLPSRRWRPVATVLAALAAVNLMAFAFTPGPLIDVPQVDNPFGAPGPLGDVLRRYVELEIGEPFWLLALLTAVVSLAARYTGASRRQRQQMKWFAAAALLFLVGVVLVLLAYEQEAGVSRPTSPALVALAIPVVTVGAVGIPIAAAVAILRHRLLDIGIVIRRSLIYGILTFSIGAAYFGLAALLGMAAGTRLSVGGAVLVTIAAILAFEPARRRLDRLAARVVFPRRMSGYELVARFGQTLEYAFDPTELAPKIASTVSDGLDLEWARISLVLPDDERTKIQRIAAHGIALNDDVQAEAVVKLTHTGETVGLVECGPKKDGALDDADRELLATLARQAALAIHNGRLAAELAVRIDEIRRQADQLAASRTRIVLAQDRERRRLERDIHDGVQQEIVALAAKLRLTRNQLRRDPALADTTLAELQHETKQTLETLRELIHGIHPAVLTDKGLLEAIESRAARLPIGITIEAEPELRSLRFATETETTAFFVVSEALANTLKHAAATHVVIRLRLRGSMIVVEVIDDGVGFVPAEATGLGLASMRDRIASVNGRLRIDSSLGNGTRLVVEVPTEGPGPFNE